jgi:hypothetical protein
MSTKTPLYAVPIASTEFAEQAFWDGRGPAPSIRYAIKKGSKVVRTGLSFARVAAMRARSERCCTAWHVDGVYDVLAEVEDSPWVEELRAETQAQWRDRWQMRHFIIYLDSSGCFEVVAESWAIVPEEIA